MSLITKHLLPSLFWDVDYSKLDWTKHEMLIVQRVIERGSINAIQEIMEYYGKARLTTIIKKISHLSPRDIAFVNVYFNINLNELKCYSKKQLNQNYLN